MSTDKQHRRHQDTEAMLRDFQRLANEGVISPGTPCRPISKQLVTWGWTKLRFNEELVTTPMPRNEDLSLRDELAATIAGATAAFGQPRTESVALAEHLLKDGWVKLAAGERVVARMSADEATQIVARALLHWEDLKDDAAARGKGPNWAREAAKKWAESPAEVSSDESELTSDVKTLECDKLILAVFVGASRPLEYTEACDQAAGVPMPFFPGRPWHRWNTAFRSLEDRGLIEALPSVEGEIKRYQLTEAGRARAGGTA